jgi:conjugative transfer signal peptidase TraF
VEQVNRKFDLEGVEYGELLSASSSSKRAIARHPGVQPRSGNKMRIWAVVFLIALLLLCSAIAAGLRINGTPSFPLGFYFAIRKRPEKGDLVFVAPPPLSLFTLAKERGYFNVAYSPTRHLLKRLAAVAGDRVTIDPDGVEVNGIRLANSAPYNHDGAGRPLRPYVLKDHILVPNEVLLMSDYNPASFDSRYFGPLQATTIESVIKPLLTWN